MAIFLDSANHKEVQEAMGWGIVSGVTTNPALLAAAGGASLDVLEPLCKLVPGLVFFQLMSRDHEAMLSEAQAAFSVSTSQIVLKIPCTLDGIRTAARLSLEIPCAMTAVYSPAQAYLACEAGARYVIPYVNRSTKLLGDGPALVAAIAGVIGSLRDCTTEILAASIKSPAEGVSALRAGAHHLALPFDVLEQMAFHPLTERAVEEMEALARLGTTRLH